MNFIVVLEPSRQQSNYGLSIWQDRQPSIIAFEGFDECLRDAVGFWRADWRETKLEAQGSCDVERVLGDVRRAVVGQPFDGMRRLADPELTLDTIGGALVVQPWLRFHIPLIEPDKQISRIRLSDKSSRLCFRVQRHLQFLNTLRS